MPGDSDAQLLFLRDLADVEPPRDRYAFYDDEDIYRLVPRPQWTGLEDEIWTPRSQEHDPQLEKVKALMKRNQTNSAGTETQPTQLSGAQRPPSSRNAALAGCPLLLRRRCRRALLLA